jgi:hypothetical protein
VLVEFEGRYVRAVDYGPWRHPWDGPSYVGKIPLNAPAKEAPVNEWTSPSGNYRVRIRPDGGFAWAVKAYPDGWTPVATLPPAEVLADFARDLNDSLRAMARCFAGAESA